LKIKDLAPFFDTKKASKVRARGRLALLRNASELHLKHPPTCGAVSLPFTRILAKTTKTAPQVFLVFVK
jgi:hypothetical protein